MTARHPIDERRRAVFLKVLAETGSVTAAAAAATPHSDGGKENRAGYRSFLDLMKRDVEFAAAVDEAKTAALGRVEQAIADRAFAPEQTPIFSRGELVGYRESYRDANTLLLRLAETLAPDRWSPRKQLKGEVQHSHQHRHEHGIVFALAPEHVLLLGKDEQELLLGLLEQLRTRLEAQERDDGRLLEA